ncbi:MAG: ATP-binding protein [Verrucomicrobiota bacterium]
MKEVTRSDNTSEVSLDEASLQDRVEAALRGLLVFCGCVAAGFLSHLLGAVLTPWTPIWFPSGIAFAALLIWGMRYWGAIFTAGFVAYFFALSGEVEKIEAILGALAGAFGMTVAAALSVYLVRKVTRWPGDLASGEGSGRLVLCGVIVGPVVGASLTFFCWFGLGFVPVHAAFVFWTVLTLSYAIGVSTTAIPILLGDRNLYKNWSRKRAMILVPLGVALVAAALLLVFVERATQRQVYSSFERSVVEVNATIQERLTQHLETLYSLQGFWESSDFVSEQEFVQFTKRSLGRYEAFVMLGWAPILEESERGRLDEEISGRGLVVDGARPFWFNIGESEEQIPESIFPLLYSVPVESTSSWLGLNLADDPALVDVMKRAQQSRLPATAMPVVSPEGDRHLFMTCHWLRGKRGNSSTEEAWLHGRGGFLIGLIELEIVVADAILVAGQEFGEGVNLDISVDRGAAESEPISSPILFHIDSASGASRNYESEMILEFSDQKWVTTFAPGFDFLGQLIGGQVPFAQSGVLLVTTLLGILLLTTAGYSVRLENEVADRTGQLAQSEEKFRQLSEAISEVFWVFNDEAQRFEYISPAFEAIWHEPARRVLDDPYVWYLSILPEDREAARVAFEKARSGIRDYDVEYRILRSDGTRRWIRDRGFPVKRDDGSIFRVVGVADDVTETRKAQRELIRSNADLERFAYLASHDLQEPLRMVTSFVQLLKKRYGGTLDTKADEYIDHAVGGTERMRRLINGLLTLSRIDSSEVPSELVDAEEAVRDAMANLSISIEKTGAQIQVESNLPEVEAVRSQLTQVFQNLIGNAIKYSDPGHAPIIEVGAIEEPNEFHLFVRDHGPGIEEQHFERVFEVFQRLETQRGEPGTGIGLSLCRRIIERHGGRIWLESEMGEGTTFHFTIPNSSDSPKADPLGEAASP